MNPKVSIGMPVYNGEKYIKEALDSLLNQSYVNFELIISDDASSDDTETICQEYLKKDSRIRYIKNHQNLGSMANFKFVLEQATGEYFMWAAQDDKWSSNWIETLLPLLKSEKTIAAFGKVCMYWDIHSRKEMIIQPSAFSQGDYEKYFLQKEEKGKAFYLYALFKRDILLKADKEIFSNSTYWSDAIFIFSLLKFGQLVSTSETIFFYRSTPNSAGKSLWSKYYDWRWPVFMAYPWCYYRDHINYSKGVSRILIFFCIPFKHIPEQFRLWKKALRYVGRKWNINNSSSA